MRKVGWITFYVRTIISFIVYYVIDLYIHYTFLLNKKVMISILTGIVIVSMFFIIRKHSVYLYGLIISGLCFFLVITEIAHVFILMNKNKGEAGFGIVEIISMAPLLIMSLVFLVLDSYRYGKQRRTGLRTRKW